MTKTEKTDGLRKDLTAEQREPAEKIGRPGNKSARYAQARRFEKFTPSREQH
jgi:hypothetical protein